MTPVLTPCYQAPVSDDRQYFPPVICDLAEICSGCEWIGKPYADQVSLKRDHVLSLWRLHSLPESDLGDFPIRAVAASGLRDKVDLVYRATEDGMRLGLYGRDRGEIVSLRNCPQMSGALQAWFDEMRGNPPPIRTGSVRLRVSPEGKRGAWLDFANLDVKNLLEHKTWLQSVMAHGIVEIGQKKKRLAVRGSGLGLSDPELAIWSVTHAGDEILPLYSVVGSFSQVGARANLAIVEEMRNSLPATVSGRWLELGAGAGNLTLPLAKSGAEVVALEIDPLAVEGLARGAREAGLENAIHMQRISFQQGSPALEAALRGLTGIVADPPRSGLLQFPALLGRLPASARPLHFVYVSCFAESLVRDAKSLYELGYRVRRLVGVDQFPQTPHCEYIASFERA